MNLTVESNKDFLVVKLDQDLDTSTAPDLEGKMAELIEKNNLKIILDFGSVTFIDSSGIGAIVRAFQELKKKNGTLVLVANNENVLKIFKLINFQKFFKIVPTVEEAVT